MNELIVGFGALSQDVLLVKANHIVLSLTGNAAFPTPAPTLAVIQAAITAYEAALSGDQTPANTVLRKSKKKVLIQQLQLLAANLETTANGDKVKLATTGFDIRKKATRTHAEMPAPQDLRLKRGTLGEVFATVTKVPAAKAYELSYAIDQAKDPWTALPAFTTSRNMKASGLQPKKDYWFRVRAINTNGPGEYSDPAMITVL